MSQLVIFGASKLGRAAYCIFGDNYSQVFFCDNDSKKWSTKIDGVEVISPDILKRKTEENGYIEIIIASQYEEEISKQLIRMGINHFRSFSYTLNNHKDNEIIEALGAYYTLKALELTLKNESWQ
jgi:FlaA1/EpsC-like NDP-sugar epimerase